MKILITGSRGFIGGSVGRFALRAGHEVLGIARSSQPGPDWTGRYLQADVLHTDLSAVIKDYAPDVVLHAAGTASVGASLDTPLDDLRAAVMTWANTLESIRRSMVRPLVLFPSSAAVYGNPEDLPVREESAIAPISPYGFHKSACELVAQEYAQCFSLPIVVCRLFSIFGDAQRRLFVWELFQQLRGAEAVAWMHGTGNETRDYLHVDDVAGGMLGLAETFRVLPSGGCTVVNLGSGQETRMLDLACRIRDLAAPGKEILCRGIERPGDPVHWRADVSRIASLVEWRPQPLPEALSRCVTAWQQNEEGPTHAF